MKNQVFPQFEMIALSSRANRIGVSGRGTLFRHRQNEFLDHNRQRHGENGPDRSEHPAPEHQGQEYFERRQFQLFADEPGLEDVFNNSIDQNEADNN